MPERFRLNKYLLTKTQIKSIYNDRYYKKLKMEGKNQSQTCEICQGKFNIYSKARHEQTKKHLKKINEINI